jgi:signal transduction histidine kinase
MIRTHRWQPSRQSLAIVGVVTAMPVLLLFALQWYLLDRFGSVTRLVLRQASQEVAFRLAAQIRRDFESPMPDLIEVVPHDAVRRGQWSQVAQVVDLKRADFWFLDRFLMWRRPDGGARPSEPAPDRVVFRSMRPGEPADASTVDGTYPERFFTDGLSRPVFEEALAAARTKANFGFASVRFNGRDYYVVFHFVYDVPDRAQLGAIMGYTIDREFLRDSYFRRVVSIGALQEREVPGFPRPTAVILDEHGAALYASDAFDVNNADNGAATFPALFFNVDLLDSKSPLRGHIAQWTVRSGYDGATIASIIERQTAQQRALWFVLALITAAGFVVAVVASVQQLRLAQLKSSFVSSVSHELKTPLAKIQLFTDTLRSGRVRSEEKAQEYYDVISAQTSKLERLVDGILEIARIEAGFRTYAREPVDLRSIAHNALESYEHELTRSGFHVEVALPNLAVTVVGDAEQLETAVGNLIGNAIKYSDGTRFLSLAVRSDHKHGVVEVADRGIGIPSSERTRIFDTFHRVSVAGDNAPAGFGLGLAIVDHITCAHGGRVMVDSEPGRGSTFRVLLPISVGARRDRDETSPGH